MAILRMYYLAICLFTILFGLASRAYSLPPFLAEYAGDTLWAMMAYWGISLLFPGAHLRNKVLAALIFSYSVEISQLYQADWINAIRETTLGGLVLGFGFLWSDILCYTAGAGIAVLIDFLAFSSFRRYTHKLKAK